VDPSTSPTRILAEDWKKLDWKMKRKIWLCISYSVLLNVSGEAIAKDL
jgi:hypothetical protein